jgi:glycosyltransferase involved in cell wall biosynthesis
LRILVVAPALPSPPSWGGAARIHGLMRGLARRHEVALLALVEPDNAHWIDIQLAATSAYSGRIHAVVNDREPRGERARRALQLRTLASPRSFERAVHHHPALQAALDRMTAAVQYDVIQVEFAMMAYYRVPPGPTLVLDEHNIEYDLRRRMFESARSGLRGVHNYLEFVKLRREERAAWRRAAGVVVTSVRDEAFVRRDAPGARTAVVPNAVDTELFTPGEGLGEPDLVAFSGSNHYYPNIEGLQYFLREIFPLVRQARPAARLLVVGYSPPELVREWSSDAVRFTGVVNNLPDELRRARAIIAPLRSGGGTRLKVLEALALGKPVVSTTIGAEGIELTPERELLIGDTAQQFAAQLERVLADDALAARLGAAGRALVQQRYDWSAAVERLEAFYGELGVGG